MRVAEHPSPIPKTSAEPSPAPSSRPERKRTGWRKAVAVLAIIVLVISGIAAAAGFFVVKPWADSLQAHLESDLKAGTDDLQRGTQAIHNANNQHNPALLADAKADFNKSRIEFQDAKSLLHANPMIEQAAKFAGPGSSYVGSRLTLVNAIIGMGLALDDVGDDTVAVDAQLLNPSQKNVSGGQRLIAVLQSNQAGLQRIHSDLARAQVQAQHVDPSLLPPGQKTSFLKAKDQIKTGLDGLAEFERLAPVLLEILGQNGLRTYLVEQIDPAELRGSGGFIGSFTLLNVDHGNISMGKSADVITIDHPFPMPGSKKYVAPPSEFAFNDHGFVFSDSGFSPDFANAARTGEDLFFSETGTKVDGVIAMDPWAVADLLTVTGPIPVPSYSVTVNAATFAEDVFQREEKQTAVANRKDFFPAVATELLTRVSSLPSEDWGKLITALNAAVEDRHLQVYFNNQSAQSEMSRINWAGPTLTPQSAAETMFEAESNLGGTKANHFVTRNYQLTLTAANGKLQHKLVIDLKNAMPDGYFGGRHYTCYIRFYYPPAATSASISGVDPDPRPSDEQLKGVKMLDGWFQIDINDLKLGYATHQVVIEYTTELPDLSHGYDIYWQKQAGTFQDAVKVAFIRDGKTYTVNSDLGQDRLIILDDKGVEIKPGKAPVAQIPALGA
jgi:Protein of unknown function (DUF4012)